MRFKKLLTVVTVFGFLFLVNGADMAIGKQEKSKAGTGQLLKGGYSTLQSTTEGRCESSCCWASGCNVECSSEYCYAECGEDDTSITYCDQS